MVDQITTSDPDDIAVLVTTPARRGRYGPSLKVKHRPTTSIGQMSAPQVELEARSLVALGSSTYIPR